MQDERLIFGKNAVLEAIRSKSGIDTVLISIKNDDPFAHKLRMMAKENNFVVKQVSSIKLNNLCGNQNHQGVAAFSAIFEFCELEDILEVAKEKNKPHFIVVLDEIEDPHNLGAIIRSAECAGADGVVIGKHRSAGITPTVVKSSAGATEYMKVCRVTNITKTIEKLKEKNIWIYGAEAGGEDFRRTNLTGDIAIVVGSEGNGISRLVKESCDVLVSIPMHGNINSLNASVAAGILLFEAAKSR